MRSRSGLHCKDIPDRPILEFIDSHGGNWCNWFDGDERDVGRGMPAGVPRKLVLAKMRMLIRRKLVGGCTCGCRGDFVLTQKGLDFLYPPRIEVRP